MPGTRVGTFGPESADSHLSQSCHHEPGNSLVPACHSASVGGLVAVSFSQCWYFLFRGGLTTPAMWPEPASMKRTGPLNNWVAL